MFYNGRYVFNQPSILQPLHKFDREEVIVNAEACTKMRTNKAHAKALDKVHKRKLIHENKDSTGQTVR